MNRKNNYTESFIIKKYLKKLNFKKIESLNFDNDAGFLKSKKNKNIIVTNDTILENVDFFKNDPAESVANKIVIYNLSDISAMGAYPYAYTLSLSIPKNKTSTWLKKFTDKLLSLQKKYNFFLIGGDLSKSNKIVISANFYGYISKDKILTRNGANINDDIWVTGTIGDSFIGLKYLQKKIILKKKFQNYYVGKYLYPSLKCIGYKINNFASSAIDISDGFYGDLEILLKQKKLGANIQLSSIPLSIKTKQLIKNKSINIKSLLEAGDDYQLIFTANARYSRRIKRISQQYNINITNVGKIVKKRGIYINNKKIRFTNKSFQHFA